METFVKAGAASDILDYNQRSEKSFDKANSEVSTTCVSRWVQRSTRRWIIGPPAHAGGTDDLITNAHSPCVNTLAGATLLLYLLQNRSIGAQTRAHLEDC